MNIRVAIWPLLAVAAVGVILFAYLGERSLPPSASDHPAVGKSLDGLQVIPLTATTLADQRISSETLRGKAVLLNIWGTWCGPCMLEAPVIDKIYKQYQDQTDFVVLPVSYDNAEFEELRTRTVDFLRNRNLIMPAYADPEGATYSAVEAILGPIGFPTTLLIDREGVIRAVWIGYSPDVATELEREVRKVLVASGEKASPAAPEAAAVGDSS